MSGAASRGPDWARGYVLDVPYVSQFTHDLTPEHLALCCGIAGYTVPDLSQPFRWLDLGCGAGVTPALLGPLYPHAEFWGVDFNPDHIGHAEALAASVGATNVQFRDCSFAELDAEGLPQFDFVVMHGVLSWVGAAARAEAMAFLRRHLKRGGIVFASYNCVPGWAASVPLRDLLAQAFDLAHGTSHDRMAAAVDVAETVLRLNPRLTEANPALADRLVSLRRQDHRYIAHEYLVREWDLFHHRDIVRLMADARLSWIGPGSVVDALPELSLTPEMQAHLAEIADPAERETRRDILLGAQFRRDLFTRGRQRAPLDVQRLWGQQVRFASLSITEELPGEVDGPAGAIAVSEERFRPYLDALAKGPASVAEIAAAVGQRNGAVPLERCFVDLLTLVAAGLARTAPPESVVAAALPASQAANRTLLAQAVAGRSAPALLLPVTGSAVTLDDVEQLLLGHWVAGRDPVTAVAALLSQRNQHISTADGEPVPHGAATEAALAEVFQITRTQRIPLLQTLGALA
ncbi:MAG: methyltransferase regulatory domain-containing protein [Alphaproteobacteria bacterium]|nr:methyltransferase regulatory domain-containing protein [Alphaproteobacteria bacterium]